MGVPYRHQFTATLTSPAAPILPLDGTFPPGFSFDASGVLSGTPTEAGSYTAKVCAWQYIAPRLQDCQTYTLVIAKAKAQPTISAKPSVGGPVGTAVRDVATIGGGSNPTGSVTFKLFSDNTCATQVFTSTVNLSGGSATSANYTPTTAGTFYWIATYKGDANNNAVSSACGAANSVVITRATPTLTGKASAGGVKGTAVRDVATLAGGSTPTGSVTFKLFSDAGCTAQVFTSTTSVVGTSATSAAFVPQNAGRTAGRRHTAATPPTKR